MVLDRAAGAVIGPMIKGAFHAYARRVKRPELVRDLRAATEEALVGHLTWVSGWSSVIQTPAMVGPAPIDEFTASVELSDVPRRFTVADGGSGSLTESMLLAATDHVVITGGPGAGKTTLMKRLVQHILTSDGTNTDADAIGCPVVLTLRRYDWPSEQDIPLWRVLLKELGIPFELVREADLNPENLVSSILNGLAALVVLDGLDEVPLNARASVARDIQGLAARSVDARVMLTCRTGDYRMIEGLREYEINPLSDGDVVAIAERMLGDDQANHFLTAVKGGPLADLLDRPLFLAQMATLFQHGGRQLPTRPVAVYRQFVRLMIQDWDRHRRIARPSAYADFDVDSKMEFLEGMAHHLTIRASSARFSHEQLIDAYARLHARFRLPPDQAEEVVKEIEGHTGLLLQSGHEHYEFAHLSLQEYLCAEYLLEEKLDGSFWTYLRQYPAPLAVATALSHFPDQYLRRMLVGFASSASVEWPGAKAYLTRLAQERPRFTDAPETGRLILMLISKAELANLDVVSGLWQSGDLIRAVAEALRRCNPLTQNADVTMALNPDDGAAFRFSSTIYGQLVAAVHS